MARTSRFTKCAEDVLVQHVKILITDSLKDTGLHTEARDNTHGIYYMMEDYTHLMDFLFHFQFQLIHAPCSCCYVY